MNNMVHIRFLSEPDRVRGFYELALKTGISSFRGGVYQVPREALKILQDQQIAYREATAEEVKEAHDQVRNPAAAVL